MSILDTFSQLREEKQSLETLASLPQTLIMNMVQRKEIPQEDLPMIMAKKAEMAQTTANMRAAQAQQQQGQAGTIMEQLLARNAAEEAARSQPAPQELTDVGIASNPVPEMRMAGGGIVAFDRGGDVEMSDEERAEYIKNNPYLQRSQALSRAPAGFVDFVKEYNPITGSKFREGVASFFNESPESQAARFRSASNRTLQAGSPNKTYDPSDISGYMQGDDTAIPEAKIRKVGPVAERQPDQKRDVPTAASPAKPSIQDEQRGIFDEYKKLYAEDKEAAAAARNEAKWQRIMEAGLNMMGGDSPYAFTNIGRGAATAARGYAEDVKGFRAEDRERKKQLAALGIKEKEMGLEGRKLDITEQRFKDMLDVERQKLNVLRQSNIDDKMAAQVEKNFATLMTEYRNSLDKGDMTVSDLYRMAQENVASTRGLKTGVTAPAARVPGYDPATRTFK